MVWLPVLVRKLIEWRISASRCVRNALQFIYESFISNFTVTSSDGDLIDWIKCGGG
jgi:hypothetical protein